MFLVVTQTFAPATGGMEGLMTGLAESLARAGHRTCVFADAARAAYAPRAHYTLRRFGGWRPLRRMQKRRALAALRTPVEAVFCDSWKSVAALPPQLTAPVAVLAHGSEYPLRPSPAKRRRIERALARAAAIIASSRFTAEAVAQFLPQKNGPRLLVVNPPVSPPPEASPQAKEAVAARLKNRAPVICALARLEPRKGIDKVVAALPVLRARYPGIVFAVGGAGADRARLEILARTLGVERHVEFFGRINDDRKAALLAASDIFAMPVRRVGTSVEGFGLSYIEAAFFGLPALGGKTGGAADAVLDGETGLLCDGESDAEVAAALMRLLGDEKLREKLGAAAQMRARAFTWDDALPRYLAALQGGCA